MMVRWISALQPHRPILVISHFIPDWLFEDDDYQWDLQPSQDPVIVAITPYTTFLEQLAQKKKVEDMW